MDIVLKRATIGKKHTSLLKALLVIFFPAQKKEFFQDLLWGGWASNLNGFSEKWFGQRQEQIMGISVKTKTGQVYEWHFLTEYITTIKSFFVFLLKK